MAGLNWKHFGILCDKLGMDIAPWLQNELNPKGKFQKTLVALVNTTLDQSYFVESILCHYSITWIY